MRLFEHDTAVVEHDPLSTLEHKTYTKKFISFNRRWRLHRPALVGLLELNGLIDKGYVSLAKSDDGKDWDIFFDEMTWTLRHNPDFVNVFLQNKDRVKNIPEMKLDQSDMTVNHAHVFTDSTDVYYENTYFSVITETNFFKETGEGLFVSEKIFRPILKKHPFILLSRPHTLNMMQNIGYKTFGSIINEDYDKEEDDCKRLLMIVDEVKRLCNLSKDDLYNFLTEARKITEYNYNVLLTKQEFLTRL
jgi:hypothetical protein